MQEAGSTLKSYGLEIIWEFPLQELLYKAVKVRYKLVTIKQISKQKTLKHKREQLKAI